MAKGNPVFSSVKLDEEVVSSDYSQATYGGVSLKTAISLVLLVVSAILCISGVIPAEVTVVLLIGSMVASFICVLLGRLIPGAAMVCTIIYAVCEGAWLGLLSFVLEEAIPGIVSGAVIVTVVIFAVSLFLYAVGLIRVGSRFRRFAFTFGLSLLIFYAIMGIGAIFSWSIALEFFGTGALGIVLSVVFLIYGCITLISEFGYATSIVENGCGKKYEWTVALGLLVSIVYIYVYVLRLLLIIAARNRN